MALAIGHAEILAQNGSTFDPSFMGNAQGNLSSVHEIVVQNDDRILIGGGFVAYEGSDRKGIARIQPDGTLDASFDLGSGLYIAPSSPGAPEISPVVNNIALYDDGRVLIGGSFHSVSGHDLRNLARLHPNGGVDLAFDSWLGDATNVDDIAVQSDGRILVAGYWDGGTSPRLVRLNVDGSYDNTFLTGTGFSGGGVSSIHVLEDDRILVAGSFQSYDGVSRRGLIRLLVNGQLDESFAIGSGTNSYVSAMDVYPNGAVLIGGRFTSVNGTPKVSFARILPDGMVDPTFDAGTGAIMDGSPVRINDVCILGDGRICVTGPWEEFQDESFDIMACMLPNGNVDPSFGWDRPNNLLSRIVDQSDGRLLIGGSFTSYMPIAGPALGISCGRIARVMGSAVGVEEFDGSIDLDVFPNPAIETVRVDIEGQGVLSLYTSRGQEVHHEQFTDQLVLDISRFVPGAYHIVLRDPAGVIRRTRVIKLRP